MSIQAVGLALGVQGVTSTEKLLLIALANYADETWRCWPSTKRLGLDTCLSVRTVRDTLRKLEEAGSIHRTPRVREDGSQATDLVELTIFSGGEAESAGGGGEANGAGGGGRICRGGVQNLPPSLRLNRQRTVKEPSTAAPAKKPARPASDKQTAFNEVWAAASDPMRQRSSQKEAMAAFEALPKRVGRDEVLAALRRYLAEDADVLRGLGQPGLHLWLRKERWEVWRGPGRAQIAAAAGPLTPGQLRRCIEDWDNGADWLPEWGEKPDRRPECEVWAEIERNRLFSTGRTH